LASVEKAAIAGPLLQLYEIIGGVRGHDAATTASEPLAVVLRCSSSPWHPVPLAVVDGLPTNSSEVLRSAVRLGVLRPADRASMSDLVDGQQCIRVRALQDLVRQLIVCESAPPCQHVAPLDDATMREKIAHHLPDASRLAEASIVPVLPVLDDS